MVDTGIEKAVGVYAEVFGLNKTDVLDTALAEFLERNAEKLEKGLGDLFDKSTKK